MKDNRILIFAGAGISAESGLNTFRDTGGLWQIYDVNEVCNFTAFKAAKNFPEKRQHIFNFYNLVKESILGVQPNAAHNMVAAWQKQYGRERVKIVTANVDDLFERAGCEDVVHVHGEIYHMHCTACAHKWHIGNEKYDFTVRCPKCDSRLTKPNIVFFGEMAPEYANMNRIFNVNKRHPHDVVMVIGSSMSVIPGGRIVQDRHHPNRGHTVLVNKDTTDEDFWFTNRFYGSATEKLVEVDQKIIQQVMK